MVGVYNIKPQYTLSFLLILSVRVLDCLYCLLTPMTNILVVGFASTTNYAAVQNLLLDIFPGRQASIMASNNLTRCLFGAAATQATTPVIKFLGVGPVSNKLIQRLNVLLGVIEILLCRCLQ
jgi:hypothetical protein